MYGIALYKTTLQNADKSYILKCEKSNLDYETTCFEENEMVDTVH